MENHVNFEQTIDEKADEQKAQGSKSFYQTVKQFAPKMKKGHPVRNALLIAGGVTVGLPLTVAAGAGYLAKKIIWPPSFKKYAKVAVAATLVTYVMHPVKTRENIKDTAIKTYHWAEKVLTKRQAADEAIEQKEKLQGQLTEREKKMQEMQSTLSREMGLKTQIKNNYDNAVQQLRIKDQKIRGLEEKVNENKNNNSLNEPVQKHEYMQSSQLSTESQTRVYPARVYPSNNNNAAVNDNTAIAGLPRTVKALEQKLAENYDYIIYVNKQINKLTLLENKDGTFELVKTYNCSTGANPGPKTMEGDKATPEGVFGFKYRNCSPDLSPLYGVGIAGLDTDPYTGILFCGTGIREREIAIEQGLSLTGGGVIVQNGSWLEIDNLVGHNYRRVAAVIEHPSRPLIK